MRSLESAVRWGRRGASRHRTGSLPLRGVVRCSSRSMISSSSWANTQLESQRVRKSKAAAAEALAFVQANHGIWEEWLAEKNLSILGHDPQRLGAAAHILFHNEVGGRQIKRQSGAERQTFATRRGCTARVATYNVLSSALSDPNYFTHCDPANLDPETRYARVIARLAPEMERNAIICLQEVSRQWASQLHSFFAQRGYHFVVQTYSKQQSGYMGVGIAIPMSQYDVVECDMRRVADTGPVSVQAELKAAAGVALQEAAEQEGMEFGAEQQRLLGVGGPQGYALRESVRYGARNLAEVAHDGHMIGAVGTGDMHRGGGGVGGLFRRMMSWLTGRGQEPEDGVLVREAQKQAAFASSMRKASAVAGPNREVKRGKTDRASRGSGEQKELPEVDVAANIEELRRNLHRGSPWELAMKRENVLLFVRLRCVRTGAVFGVATYHMPCMYWAPRAMLVQAALAAQLVQSLADPNRGEAFVFLGDFNFTPGSAPYQLYTTATLPQRHRDYPRPPGSMKDLEKLLGPGGWSWRPDLTVPMQSAYALVQGTEPAFTNYAKVRDDPEFVDTLDYIFVSRRCEVLDVLPLPDLADAKRGGPQPTAGQPSDHLLLAASIRFPTTRGFGASHSKVRPSGAAVGSASRSVRGIGGSYLGKKPRKIERRPKALRKHVGRYTKP